MNSLAIKTIKRFNMDKKMVSKLIAEREDLMEKLLIIEINLKNLTERVSL